MGEPLTRMDTASQGVLADAALRLELALQTLERVFASGVSPVPAPSSAQVVELESARRRGRELEAAAAEASKALGLAVAEVQRALEEDEIEAQDPQTSLFGPGLLDSPLESGPGLPDDDQTVADGSAAEKEPTA